MNIYVKTILDTLEAINGGRALSLAILLRNADVANTGMADFETLTSLGPQDFNGPHQYMQYAQAQALISKNANFDLLPKAEHDTVVKWFASEQRCADTNHRMLNSSSSWYDVRLNTAREWITTTLSAFEPQIHHILTSGASLDAGGSRRHLCYKLLEATRFTPRSANDIKSLRSTDWQLLEVQDHFPSQEIVDYNELMFIPKSWKELRGICTATKGNMSLQKHRGNLIRRRLFKRGFDLSTMQELHKLYARNASMSDGCATIDLKAASDSLATQTVKRVLPSLWFTELNNVREVYTKLPNGKFHFSQKFGAMGNGFTFELETLIFLGLCHAVHVHGDLFNGPPLYSVYGDDIIVERRNAQDVISLLKYVGFETNVEKTFTQGPFRESCGGDYWCGADVRPVFLKKEVSTHANKIVFINSIRRISRLSYGDYGCDPAFKRAWLRSLNLINREKYRTFGPPDCGDAIIWVGRSDYVGNYYKHWRSTFATYVETRRTRVAECKSLAHATVLGTLGDSKLLPDKRDKVFFRKLWLSSLNGFDSTWDWLA